MVRRFVREEILAAGGQPRPGYADELPPAKIYERLVAIDPRKWASTASIRRRSLAGRMSIIVDPLP